MPLFGRRGSRMFSHSGDVPGLAKAAADQGWRPAGNEPFGMDLGKAIHEITRSLYGVPREGRNSAAVGETSLSDTFHGSFAGRTVTVANTWTPIDPMLMNVTDHRGIATVCAAQMPSILRLAIQPRGSHPVVPPSLFQPTGNPAFDEAFSAAGGTPGTIECVLTPAVQRRIMAHDDWVFRAEGYLFACVRKGKFRDVEEIRHQVAEVMDVVRAIPESVRHRYIDRSADDLAARISRLENLDEATEFLRHLSRTDRENLAESNTPLAAFADVWTPEQAEARFQSLDPQRRWQLIAMFRRAEEERGQPGANGNGRR